MRTLEHWESKTGGQLASFIITTAKAGGPKPEDFPDDSRSFWVSAAEFWYFRYSDAFSDAGDTLQ